MLFTHSVTNFSFSFRVISLQQTSREGLLEQRPWNTKLRDAVAPCFLDAIAEFKRHPILYKKFVQFIPWTQIFGHDRFIAPIRERIMNDAKNSTVIRTRSETWIQPAQALFVPRSLIFKDKPLFSDFEVGAAMGRAFEYVDSEFERHRDLLFALGSRIMDVGIVNAIITRSFSFSEKSYEWIRELFQYLYV